MKREKYLAEIGLLALEVAETEKQISGLANRKKQLKEEMNQLHNQMVDEARNGRLYEEE